MRKVFFTTVIVLVALAMIGVVIFFSDSHQPLASVRLADGRVFRIEGVSYGTNHVIGQHSVLVEHFSPWLPKKLRDFLSPKFPRSEINHTAPTLAVWVNAIDPAIGQTSGLPEHSRGVRGRAWRSLWRTEQFMVWRRQILAGRP